MAHIQGIRLVVFDLDGTLINAYPAIIESVNYTLSRLGYHPQSALSIRRCVGWGYKNLLKPFVSTRDYKRAFVIYRRYHGAALMRSVQFMPGADALIKYLKRKGYVLAVASNRPTHFSRIILKHLEIDACFDYVLCGDRLAHIKPHPEVLKRIMKRLRFQPVQTVYIGDMALDAQAGRRASVRTIIVSTGSSSRAEIKVEAPYRVIESLRKLRALL
jgi:phosphoglycolate phosphatase